jgi:rod shape determining protein RodA
MLKIDRRLIKNFDWITFFIIIILTTLGIITIFSATRPPLGIGEHKPFYLKQIIWLFISIIALFLIIIFDYSWFYKTSYPLYIIGIIALLIATFVGKTTMGAQRWIDVGLFSFQPSEFFRVAFIIAFSTYLTNIKILTNLNLLKGLFLFLIIPIVLLLKQPDLGTAVLLTTIFMSLSLIKGVSKKIIIAVIALSILSVPFLGHIFWEGLRDYQKNRIIAFIDPDVDPAGIGYHINQSKITIGSGSLIGKGYLRGTQGPLRFLPEKHTDFIFSVFAEEWGFIGSLFMLLLYLALFLRGIDTAMKSKDEFGKLVAIGITIMFLMYFFVNIGMTLGMMPVVGVPLPFVSYGGTALLSNFIAAGMLINIRMRRFQLFYPY